MYLKTLFKRVNFLYQLNDLFVYKIQCLLIYFYFQDDSFDGTPIPLGFTTTIRPPGSDKAIEKSHRLLLKILKDIILSIKNFKVT